MYIHLNGLGQPRGPLPQPVVPGTPPAGCRRTRSCQRSGVLNLAKSKAALVFHTSRKRLLSHALGGGTSDPGRRFGTTGIGAAKNVAVSCRYLIIRDFGVDWRHVKLAARNEQLLEDHLNRFETDKSLFFRIVGYSDCVDVERRNLFLRKGRAQNVFRLLGKSARSRVITVIAAPPETYLTENSTVAGRANNRAVVIEFFVSGSQTI